MWLRRKDDPHLIVLGADVSTRVRALFRDAKGREPTALEMATLRERWVDSRSALPRGAKLRVDQGARFDDPRA
jgi:hypothetical protein